MNGSTERLARTAVAPQSRAWVVKPSWSRLVKIGGAVSAVAIGAYAVLSDQLAIGTSHAVVSAYAITLRTPIDGVVSGAALRVGTRVSRGETLAEVENLRVDDQRLVDLREDETGARARLVAAHAERETLESLRADLERRFTSYVTASTARLQGTLVEAESTRAAQSARRDEAERILKRRQALSVSGFTSKADLDKARSDLAIASHETNAQGGRVGSLRAQIAAIQAGVVSEAGANDVAYSRQRADEVGIRIADLARQSDAIEADIRQTVARLDNETARIGRLRSVAMVAPASGIIWKIDALPGEHVTAGAPVAQIVDCDAAFVLAQVPQNRVPEIVVGSTAEYRLAGDSITHQGVVTSVTGDAIDGERILAAIPAVQPAGTATVRIATAPGEGSCAIGRTARVIMSSGGSGLLAGLYSWFR